MPGLDHRLFLAQDYAVINPLQVGAEGYADLDVLRLLPRGFERHERMMPLLLELRGLQEGQRIELLERADRWSRSHDMPLFSALLACPADRSSLAFHLQGQMRLQRPGAGPAWLRWHDPRVFRHLRWLLTPAQMLALMGPITAWAWHEPLLAQWHVHERAEGHPHARLSLNPTQWSALEQFEALSRRLRELAEHGGDFDDAAAQRVLSGLLECGHAGPRRHETAMESSKDAW